MAFEHKSLKANFAQFRGSLDRINRLLIKGNEVAPQAETNISGLVDQLGAVVEDVEAMAMLGNGSGGFGEAQDAPKQPPVSEQVQPPPANPAPVSSPPAVGQGVTFQQG